MVVVMCGGYGTPLASAADGEAIRVILVGDSTMATRTGYGDALCNLFEVNVTCINLAKGGRSSGSYRAEGSWERVLQLLFAREPFANTYVLIQFGHNDQPGKPGRSTDLATEFPVNLARYVVDVKANGALPVLVTPLTRRIFRNNVLQNDLKPWANATRDVAAAHSTPLLDLNTKSAAVIVAMGSPAADTLAEEPPPTRATISTTPAAEVPKVASTVEAQGKFDYTHLGAKGASLFARMVANEFAQAVPSIAKRIKPDTSGK